MPKRSALFPASLRLPLPPGKCAHSVTGRRTDAARTCTSTHIYCAARSSLLLASANFLLILLECNANRAANAHATTCSRCWQRWTTLSVAWWPRGRQLTYTPTLSSFSSLISKSYRRHKLEKEATEPVRPGRPRSCSSCTLLLLTCRTPGIAVAVLSPTGRAHRRRHHQAAAWASKVA